ncbi:uncharacterized protein LOC111341650 isoform X1 [Stylophora pistillata]|uniref:uncharacterized protein LOC111341650 isoform X1 n=1 Tax=Stylophora pistillata TaxID=50429 RepID=UPI000C047D65|nr:uncharacterized protein LOC111341650 isoform X1 [Stylophora pistillata]
MADTNTNGNRNPTTSNQVNPPKLDPELKVLKDEDLPTETKLWKDTKKDILPVDFLLLTVRDFEFLGCLTFLKDLEKSYQKNLGYVHFGAVGNGEKKMKVAVMKSQMGASGVGAAVITVRNAVPILRPRAVFYVGICASLKKEKLKLGDVVVCRKLATYSSIKRTEKGIENRNVVVPISKNLLNFIKNITDGWKPPLENPASQDVKVCKEGVFLSGPEVVDSKKRRDELIRRTSVATAIECEGEGLFAAAYDLDIEWCVIKGVSDYADGKKSETDSWRQFASIMAASLVTHAVKDVNVFESWPHFEDEDDSDDEDSSPRKRRRSSSRSSSSDSKRNKGTAAFSIQDWCTIF